MAIQSGITSAEQWQQFDASTIIVHIVFENPFPGSGRPVIAASLGCSQQPQPPTSGVRVMNSSNSVCMAMVQLADGSELTPAEARAYNWTINWIAIGND